MNLSSMGANEECLMCFNNTEKCFPFPKEDTEKILNNCLTYLDPSIAIKPVCNNEQLFFCNHCFDFASELNKLEDRLEILQNRLSNLSSTFSRAIMCRRQLFSNRKKVTTKRKADTVEMSKKPKQGLIVNNTSGLSLIGSVDSSNKVQKIYLVRAKQKHSITGSQLQNNIRGDLAKTSPSHPVIAPSCKNLLLNVKSETNPYDAMDTDTIDSINSLVPLNLPDIDSIDPLIHKNISNPNTGEGEDAIDIENIKSESDCRLLDDDREEAEEVLPNFNLQENQNDFASTENDCPTNTPKKDKVEIVNLEDDDDDITILSDSDESSKSTESLETPIILPDTVRHDDVDELNKADEEEEETTTTDKNSGETSGGSENRSLQKDANSSKNVEETSASSDKSKPFKCVTCQQSFMMKNQLDTHMIIHTYEKLNPFICSFALCNRSFRTNEMLEKHEKMIHMCPFCTKCFSQKVHLETHIKTHKQPLKCQFCGKTFLGATALIFHQKIHKKKQVYSIDPLIHENNPYTVDTMEPLVHKNLPTSNTDQDKDTIDIENIKPESESLFLDDDRAETEEVLTNSQKDQHDFSPTENDCATNSPNDKEEMVNSEDDDDVTILSDSDETSKSTESFQTPIILINTVRHVDSDETNKAGEKEIQKTTDEDHGETSGGPVNTSPEDDATTSNNVETTSTPTGKIKPFKCMTCQQSFMRKARLQIHETTHTGENPYKCSLCNRSFRSKGMLTTHEKTHKCPICSTSFSRKEELEFHKKTHKHQLACQVCGKEFMSAHNLVAHEKTHAKQHKVYKCSFCEEVFVNTSKLKEHEKFHSQEKPFECSFCIMTFASIDLLIKHETIHEEEEMGIEEEQDV